MNVRCSAENRIRSARETLDSNSFLHSSLSAENRSKVFLRLAHDKENSPEMPSNPINQHEISSRNFVVLFAVHVYYIIFSCRHKHSRNPFTKTITTRTTLERERRTNINFKSIRNFRTWGWKVSHFWGESFRSFLSCRT